jgi:hypothetical protein
VNTPHLRYKTQSINVVQGNNLILMLDSDETNKLRGHIVCVCGGGGGLNVKRRSANSNQ